MVAKRSWRMRLGLVLSLVCGLPSCARSAAPAVPQAALLVSKGQLDPARELLLRYLAEHPRALPERRMLVRVEAFRGQLGAANEQVVRLKQQLGPTSPIPFVELGFALEIAHRYDEALAAYDEAARAAPRDPLGPLTGGLRAARWGEVAEAEPRLLEALRRDPKAGSGWHALGLVRFSRGNPAGAEEAYRAGLLADPQAVENRVGLATLALSRGDSLAALREYEALLEARPRLADAELGRAFALLELGRFDEASTAIARAERLGGDAGVIARQRRELGRRRSARQALPAPASP